MAEWLLLLAPIALLAIVLLFGFVGCAEIIGLDEFVDGEIPPPPVYGDLILATPDLVSYWRLGEGSGTTAADEKGANPGTYTSSGALPGSNTPGGESAPAPGTFELGEPGLIASDPVRTSVLFNGGYASVPHDDNTLDPPSFSVEAWVFPMWDKTEKAYRSVVTSRDGLQERGYILYAAPTSGDPENPYRWEAWVGDGVGNFAQALGPVVVFGATAHLVVTYNHLDKILKLYVDGSLPSEKGADYQPNTTYPLYIGAGATEAPTPAFPFNGRIQEVAVYARALSYEEVFARYSANR